APAVRIGVLELRAAQERAAFLEHGENDGIRLPYIQSVECGGTGRVPRGGIDVNVPAGVDAAGEIEAVTLAGIEVVCAVRGCGVDGACAGVGSDVGGEDAED